MTAPSSSVDMIFVRTLELQWHYSAPQDNDADRHGIQGRQEGVTSIDFHPKLQRILTTGGDCNIILWQFHAENVSSWLKNAASCDMSKCCSWITTLQCQDMPRCARWSPCGAMLASTHSDPRIRLWWKTSSDQTPSTEGSEVWKDLRLLSGHLHEVMDVSFSPDSRHIVSAGMQGAILVHDIESIAPVVSIEAHTKFCHGVSWDPWNMYVATFGGGPSLLVHSVVPRTDTRRMQLVGQRKAQVSFHGEGVASNMRRMSWSPDGLFLAVPFGKASTSAATAGATSSDTDFKNCLYLFLRGQFEHPAMRFAIRDTTEIRGVQWAPCFFEPLDGAATINSEDGQLNPSSVNVSTEQWGSTDYRMAFAVWTEESVYVYTTDQHGRYCDCTDLHMLSIADVTWSFDARYILTCSLDGYVSVIFFDRPIGKVFTLPTFSSSPVCRGIVSVRTKLAVAAEEYEAQRTKIIEQKQSGSEHGPTAVHAAVKKKKRKVEAAEGAVGHTPAAGEPLAEIALDELVACIDA